jgi:hypothetical protein
MSVVIFTKKGQWYEVSLLRVVTVDPGLLAIHEGEAKNQTNISKRGDSCLFIQVYLLPINLSSSSLKLLIATLKFSISLTLPQAYSYLKAFLLE